MSMVQAFRLLVHEGHDSVSNDYNENTYIHTYIHTYIYIYICINFIAGKLSIEYINIYIEYIYIEYIYIYIYIYII